MSLFDRMLHDDEEDLNQVPKIVAEKREEKKEFDYITLFMCLGLFAVSLTARLYFIFYIGNPDNPGAGWFGDAYHHWQIAYLSKEIGFDQSFLRLWDLKGMEFFWGLLHPLMTYFAFLITGSISIGVERGMTAFFGSLSVAIIYLLCKRFWNTSVALSASLFAALNPVGVFNDGSGMVEPLGIPFLLLGVYFWPKKPFLVGLVFAIALMARAEYWVFAIALIFAMITFYEKKHFDAKTLLIIGFVVPLLLYMKYLLDYTGNPIYPLYYNYITNIFGTWQHKKVLDPQDIFAKYLFLGILITTVLSALLVLKKKPVGMYLYLLGLGNWIFLGATFGLGAYIKSYATYVWYVRFMIWPYAFLGIVLSVILFYLIPKVRFINIFDKLKLNWLIFIVILLATQGIWYFIINKYNSTHKNWDLAVSISKGIAKNYHGGGLLLGEGNPEIVYALVRSEGIEGKNIVSQMFDPYFYMTEEDPYKNWGDNREPVLKWIKKNNIRTIATYSQSERYRKLVDIETEYFSDVTSIQGSNIVIYKVNDKLYEDEI